MNKKIGRNKLDVKTSASVLLGVFVCFFMIAVYSIYNSVKTSYALPNIDAANIEILSTQLTEVNKVAPETDWLPMKSIFAGKAIINGQTYFIDMFCLEHTKGMPNTGLDYNKQETSTLIDEGITYIVNTAYKNVTAASQDDGIHISLSTDAYYNAQMAIWIYQNIVGNSTQDDLNKMWTAVQKSSNGNAKIIKDYVEKAIEVKKDTTQNAITISSGSPELKLSSDGKYYETDLLTVDVTTAPNTTFSGFKLAMNESEYDTTIVDESGNTIADSSELLNKKFKIRVDASSISAGTTAKITGDFSGVFTHNTFATYSHDADSQIALLATNISNQQTIPLKLDITVPDTGVDYSQYIYMIGAMVLVIGLTVIYVNTKQREN